MKPSVLLSAALVLAPIFAASAEFRIGDHNFTLPEGFTIEKVAGPGLVDRPIVADFDEEGRFYVAESSGSNDPVDKQLKEKPHRIVRLEDSNGDGVFDKSIVFADKMMFPEGAMWHEGSLYVSAPPIIWKLTDTDNDGVADKREEWLDAKTLTGCANDLHGPYFGLDGWIYWCKGAFAKQTYDRPGAVAFETRAAHIFRRRPEGGPVEAVMTGGMDNPVEVAFTPEGERIFTTTFFQHPGGGQRDGLVHAIYGGVYGKVHDVIDGHKRTGDLMPVLTHLGPAAPSGLTRYQSEGFGREYRDNLFAALFNLHKVTRHVLKPKGATYQTENSDFLVSDNTDFHPTDVIQDADGSLLVINTGGWYKLCCPTSQLWKPDVLGAIYRVRSKSAAKVTDPRGESLDWANLSAEKLAEMLSDARPAVVRRAIQKLRATPGNATKLAKELKTQREERARVNAVWALTGNVDPEAAGILNTALDGSAHVKHAALHALAVTPQKAELPRVAKLLGSAEPPNVRRAAAELLGRMKNKGAIEPLLLAAEGLRTDGKSLPDRVAEHSILYALIEINSLAETRVGLAATDPFVRRAALIALDQMSSDALQAREVIPLLSAADPVLRQTAHWIAPHHKEWSAELAEYISGRVHQGAFSEQERGETIELVTALAGTEPMQELVGKLVADSQSDVRTRQAMFTVMARAELREPPQSWTQSIATLLKSQNPEPELISAIAALHYKEIPRDIKSALQEIARDNSRPETSRLEAISALSPKEPLEGPLFNFVIEQLNPAQTHSNRRLATAIIAKSNFEERQLIALCDVLKSAGPLEVSQLLAPFEKGSTEAVGNHLLKALKESRAVGSLSEDQVQRAFAKFPPATRESARLFAATLNVDSSLQNARIEEMLPKLTSGDIRRGQAIFNSQAAACSSCHAIGYLGGNVGPDLTRIGQVRTERDLLEAILYPSASFVRSFEPVVIETKGGDVHSGILKKDAADELILVTGPGAEVRLARSEVADLRPGKVSVMPQGLDQQLSTEQLADLITFLRATRW